METLSRNKLTDAFAAWNVTDTSVSAPVTIKLKLVEYGAQLVVMVFDTAVERLPAESVTFTSMSIVGEPLDALR